MNNLHIDMIDLEKKFSNLKSELPYVLGNAYSRKGRYEYSFVESMFERFAEAHAQGAVFFGPVAVIPQNDKHSEWIIKDLRVGWGYYPINLDFSTDPGVDPTLDKVCENLTFYERSLRRRADSVGELIRKLCE